MRENQENERNFEGGRGRGGRGLGPRSRGGGHVGLATRQRGRGGPRGAGGPRTDFAERGGGPAEGLGQIDTWNPIGSEKQEKQDQRLRHNKDAFENAGNWGDDFPGRISQSYWQIFWSKSDSLVRHCVHSTRLLSLVNTRTVAQWLNFQLLRTGTMMNTPVPCQTRKSSRPVEVLPRLLGSPSTVLLVTLLQEVIIKPIIAIRVCRQILLRVLLKLTLLLCPRSWCGSSQQQSVLQPANRPLIPPEDGRTRPVQRSRQSRSQVCYWYWRRKIWWRLQRWAQSELQLRLLSLQRGRLQRPAELRARVSI